MPKAGGKWNTFKITAQGPRIVVVMNGVRTAETDKAHALRGNIGLQSAQGIVKFRKVGIKPPFTDAGADAACVMCAGRIGTRRADAWHPGDESNVRPAP